MLNNLQMYHKLMDQFCQWLPGERITRIRNMALMVTGLYAGRKVHLSKIVQKWPQVAGKDVSLVNRLRRFLDNPRVEVRQWYKPIAVQVVQVFAGQRIRLVIDCTKIGFRFRLLTVSIAYKKRTLPLAWSVHRGRKGHVCVEKQVALLEYVAQLLAHASEVWVMGDAGFESVHLLTWLQKEGWHFVLRQPGKNKVRWSGQDWVKLADIPLQEGETRYIGWVHLTQKHDAGPFWLILHWEPGEEEPWYLVSDCAGQRMLINLYKIRMWVEEMYGDMKGHGFDLEATHLDDADRISRLVLAVSITFVWLLTLGAWVVKRGYRHLVDRKDRRDKSYFRIGWDWLERRFRLGLPIRLQFVPIL